MIRIAHLLTNTEDEREERSIHSILKVADAAGTKYVAVINPVWTKDFPPPREATDRPFQLTKAHYGCWKAHRDALAKYLTPDVSGLVIFECDAVPILSIEESAKRIWRAAEVCHEHPEILAFQFGYRHSGKATGRITDDVITIDQWIETHGYYVPLTSKPTFDEIFSEPWDALDYTYTIRLCDIMKAKIAIFSDRPIFVQGLGKSLIDDRIKDSEFHYRAITYSPVP